MNMITETMNPEHHMAVVEITNGGQIANRDGKHLSTAHKIAN